MPRGETRRRRALDTAYALAACDRAAACDCHCAWCGRVPLSEWRNAHGDLLCGACACQEPDEERPLTL